MPDLETRIRAARPHWPEPPDAREGEILRSMGLAGDAPVAAAGPSAWLSRGLRSRRTRLLLAVAALACSGAALAVALVSRGGAGATGERASLAFGRPEVVGDLPGYESALDVAVDPAGRVAIAWTRAGRVVVSMCPRGGDWSAPVRLSDPARRAAYPRIGAGPEGRFTVIWRERLPGRRVERNLTLPDGSAAGALETRVGIRWQIVARTVEPGTRWGPVERVSEATGTPHDLYRPELSAAASGDVTAAFAAGGAAWSARRSADGSWTRRPIGATPGDAVDVRLHGGRASGWTIATWQARAVDPVRGPLWRSWASVRSASGAWSRPHELGAAGPGTRRPAAAIGRDGTAVAAWAADGFVATVRRPSGDWSPVATALRPPGPDAEVLDPPAVGVDRRGVAALAGVFHRRRSFPGGYSTMPSPPRLVRREGDVWGPDLAMGGSPMGLAIVPDAVGGLVVLSGRRRPARGASVRPIAPDGGVERPRPAPPGMTPARLAIGDDGTSALVGLRPAQDGARLQVLASIAPGTGRP